MKNEMKNKLLVSTIVAATLLAPAAAFAQAETAAPPETKSEAAPPKAVHHAKSTHVKSGTTTGMSNSSASRARPGGESVARKPAD